MYSKIINLKNVLTGTSRGGILIDGLDVSNPLNSSNG